ncbi:MAG: cation:proton antiporter subunit C [Proteobacteria bacterium]|nr:cation:proton antiporter subunit C [Pseudomonadota bacterium]MBU1710947.1 cation:proton antiporter subunit C [Pseudomonadota bacterium]
MNTNLLYDLAGILLVAFGLFALIVCAHPLRKILAVNIMSTGVFLVFIATAYGTGMEAVDPVPQAMVLTGIIVSLSITALALILACRIQETTNLFRLRSEKSEDQRAIES